jgi:hypothetical protein
MHTLPEQRRAEQWFSDRRGVLLARAVSGRLVLRPLAVALLCLLLRVVASGGDGRVGWIGRDGGADLVVLVRVCEELDPVVERLGASVSERAVAT